MAEEVRPVTTWISADEPAWAMVEVDLPPPDFKEKHRYQITYVARDDNLAIFKRDLGLASNFKTTGFRIPSVWLHTVGELWDIAADLHKDPDRTEGFIEPRGDNLIFKYFDLVEAEKAYKAGRKHY